MAAALSHAAGLRAVADAMSERVLQAAVLELLARHGWLAFHAATAPTVRRGAVVHRTAQLGDRGFPDLACVHAAAGRSVFIELKAQRGRLGPGQQEWLDAYRNAGAEVYLFKPADWLSGGVQRVLDPKWQPGVVA